MKNLINIIVFIVAIFVGSIIVGNVKKSNISANEICDYARSNMQLPIQVDEITTLTDIKCRVDSVNTLAYHYIIHGTQDIIISDLNEYDKENWQNNMRLNLLEYYCFNKDFKVIREKNFMVYHIYEFNNKEFMRITLTPNNCE